MSAAVEREETIEVGDSVFVHPGEEVPDHQRGMHGTVVALDGAQAQLRSSTSSEAIWVKSDLLRPDRRRPRPLVRWVAAS